MGILKFIRDWMGSVIEESYCIGQYYGEIKKIKDKNRQKLIASVQWTDEQEREFKTYWKQNYGRKISSDWAKLYQSFTGQYHADYFPEILFSSKLEPMLDMNPYNDSLKDKNLLAIYTIRGGVKIPTTLASRCNGIYRNRELNVVSDAQFYDGLFDIGEVVIKPTIESGSGRGVRFVKMVKGVDVYSGSSLDDTLLYYGSMDFAVQEVVRTSECLKKLYPYSVNTFRVMTYIWEGKIYSCPVLLRLGRHGNRLDNAHAGGIFIGINDDGKLFKFAYSEQGQRFSEHPDTNTKFEGYQIEKFELIADGCIKLHAITPQLGFISWDVTLDEDNELTLLEINTRGGGIWLAQMAQGLPVFREHTCSILQTLGRKN